ncbi:MAG: acetyl-CoA carboxylase biotin carboxylase subunit [Planctomycetota bacterium]
MFSRVLIANRGEIALRIMRACKELGIETVAVFSQADRDASYLRMADAKICIGAASPAESYLNIPRIISAAEVMDVDAIHPGYGFLAENSHFAEVCRSCRIQFIGPTPEAMLMLGNKARARDFAQKEKVPIIPGSKSLVENDEEALKIAHEVGYPVVVKAAAGGGGRGMRVAHNDVSLVNGLMSAKAEAEVAFKDASVYIEKYIEQPRHIEFQILADTHGNVVHLGERDCTLQRRHQKLVEESPSPVMTRALRREMGEAAVHLARSAGYSSVGTIEFLMDRGGRFYFIEMNTRIQVEHPVTEMVTGIDIVKEQIRVAAGEKLTSRQQDIILRGSAVECRINAEDPEKGFKPCPGRITRFIPPGGFGVRVDTHAHAGYLVPPNYDSLVAKLIVHRPTRSEALSTMKTALQEFLIEGIKTTIPLHQRLMGDNRFAGGDVDTHYVEALLEGLA